MKNAKTFYAEMLMGVEPFSPVEHDPVASRAGLQAFIDKCCGGIKLVAANNLRIDELTLGRWLEKGFVPADRCWYISTMLNWEFSCEELNGYVAWKLESDPDAAPARDAARIKRIGDDLHTLTDDIRSIQSLMDAVGKFNPGGHEDRLSSMAEKQLEDVHGVIDRAVSECWRLGGNDNG